MKNIHLLAASKPETLEEAVERAYPKEDCNNNATIYSYEQRKIGFIAGAQWQAKKCYSAEEVLEILNKRDEYINSVDDILDYKSNSQWFEQFKKI